MKEELICNVCGEIISGPYACFVGMGTLTALLSIPMKERYYHVHCIPVYVPKKSPEEQLRSLEKAVREVITWEADYRRLNNLGHEPPQCFKVLLSILGDDVGIGGTPKPLPFHSKQDCPEGCTDWTHTFSTPNGGGTEFDYAKKVAAEERNKENSRK